MYDIFWRPSQTLVEQRSIFLLYLFFNKARTRNVLWTVGSTKSHIMALGSSPMLVVLVALNFLGWSRSILFFSAQSLTRTNREEEV